MDITVRREDTLEALVNDLQGVPHQHLDLILRHLEIIHSRMRLDIDADLLGGSAQGIAECTVLRLLQRIVLPHDVLTDRADILFLCHRDSARHHDHDEERDQRNTPSKTYAQHNTLSLSAVKKINIFIISR